jgi:hypothetical protein
MSPLLVARLRARAATYRERGYVDLALHLEEEACVAERQVEQRAVPLLRAKHYRPRPARRRVGER